MKRRVVELSTAEGGNLRNHVLNSAPRGNQRLRDLLT